MNSLQHLPEVGSFFGVDLKPGSMIIAALGVVHPMAYGCTFFIPLSYLLVTMWILEALFFAASIVLFCGLAKHGPKTIITSGKGYKCIFSHSFINSENTGAQVEIILIIPDTQSGRANARRCNTLRHLDMVLDGICGGDGDVDGIPRDHIHLQAAEGKVLIAIFGMLWYIRKLPLYTLDRRWCYWTFKPFIRSAHIHSRRQLVVDKLFVTLCSELKDVVTGFIMGI
ncbi:jg22602 [Pararge aegeria aegeria]|uniref:Jg22602 protein n=1 Tax=Pararge aegeria aegeria TaxID=348720 RepID=A0A8S4SJQ3_9NEOP|nr:jg22602 [Pararge aegeria aegeria]